MQKKDFLSDALDAGAAAAGQPRHARRRSASADSIRSPTVSSRLVAAGQAQFDTPPALAHAARASHGNLTGSRSEVPTGPRLKGVEERQLVTLEGAPSTALRNRAQLLPRSTMPVRTAATVLVPTSATVPVAATCLVPTAIAPNYGAYDRMTY